MCAAIADSKALWYAAIAAFTPTPVGGNAVSEDNNALFVSAGDGFVFGFGLPNVCGVPNVLGNVGLNSGAGEDAGLAVLLPVLPLALSSFKLLLLSSGFSIVGLAVGLVVSAAALLCPALDKEVVEVVVAGVEAGLLMAPL